MLEKATVLTTLFTIVDDVMKGSAVIQHALQRPGPMPQLSDSEVITLALYQELIGEPREEEKEQSLTHILSALTHFYSSESRKRVLVKPVSLRLDQRTCYGS